MIILTMFRYMGTIALPAIFLYKYMRINYPDKTNHLIQQSLWFTLKLDTQVNIIFNKTRNYFNDNILKSLYNLMSIKETKNITFVKDGIEIENMSYNKVILANQFPNYDFILFNTTYNDTEYTVRFNDINKIKEINTNTEYIPQPSSISFLSVEINLVGTNTDIKYKIKMNEVNWYVVGNILFDREFIHWYLVKYYNLDIDSVDNINYTICLIDNNVNIMTLTQDFRILIKEDTYEVL